MGRRIEHQSGLCDPNIRSHRVRAGSRRLQSVVHGLQMFQNRGVERPIELYANVIVTPPSDVGGYWANRTYFYAQESTNFKIAEAVKYAAAMGRKVIDGHVLCDPPAPAIATVDSDSTSRLVPGLHIVQSRTPLKWANSNSESLRFGQI